MGKYCGSCEGLWRYGILSGEIQGAVKNYHFMDDFLERCLKFWRFCWVMDDFMKRFMELQGLPYYVALCNRLKQLWMIAKVMENFRKKFRELWWILVYDRFYRSESCQRFWSSGGLWTRLKQLWMIVEFHEEI